jgi:hypothetical protein
MEANSQRKPPATLLPGKETPDTHWIGGWVGPKAGLDAVEKRNIYFLCQESISGSVAVLPLACRFTDWD